MLRSLVGALCGVLLGAFVALPVWLVILVAEHAASEHAEMHGEENRPVPVAQRTAQLFQFAVQTGGFGGVVGSVVGGTSAVVAALQRRGPKDESAEHPPKA